MPVPTLGPVGVPFAMNTKTPGNFMTSIPSTLIAVPPRTAQNLFAASTSGAIVYHWPNETPSSFGGYNCDQDSVAGQSPVNVRMKISLFTSLLCRNLFEL